jgi:phospholipase D
MILLFVLWTFAAAEAPDTRLVVVRFSPKGGAETLLIEELSAAKSKIRLAIYGLTNPRLVDAMVAAKKRKVDVSVKADRTQSGGPSQKVQIKRLKDGGVKVEISKLSRQLHDKFAVIDGRKVTTGSYNWTNNAELRNAENLVVMDCKDTAAAYEREWERLK